MSAKRVIWKGESLQVYRTSLAFEIAPVFQGNRLDEASFWHTIENFANPVFQCAATLRRGDFYKDSRDGGASRHTCNALVVCSDISLSLFLGNATDGSHCEYDASAWNFCP